MPRQPYPIRRRARRHAASERQAARVVHAVQAGVVADPLDHGTSGKRRLVLLIAFYGVVSLALHALLPLLLGAAGQGTDAPRIPISSWPMKVVVNITEPPPPEPIPEAVPDPIAVAPVPEPEPAGAPPKPKPKPRAATRKVRKRTPEPPPPAAAPPADPIDAPQEAPAAPPSGTPRRRIVGLSMGSTTTTGAGPKFAVGNTRMGQTSDRAEAPGRVEKLPPGTTGTPGAKSGDAPTGTSKNRVARRVPVAGVKLEKPRRIGKVALGYPAALKAQNIEGNVLVRIGITAAGTVASVTVVKGSGHREFDEAAQRAARRERFSPATRNGKPVSFELKYTYRFRIQGA